MRTYNNCDDSFVIVRLRKSKVSPVKAITIPKLELYGALLGARLYKKIVNSRRLSFDNIYFWTDSTIVMGWIHMSRHSLKTFVQHRVTEINELTSGSIWLHVSGKDNPADLVSGLVAPFFLLDKYINFEVNHNTYDSIEFPELKKNKVFAVSNARHSLMEFTHF